MRSMGQPAGHRLSAAAVKAARPAETWRRSVGWAMRKLANAQGTRYCRTESANENEELACLVQVNWGSGYSGDYQTTISRNGQCGQNHYTMILDGKNSPVKK